MTAAPFEVGDRVCFSRGYIAAMFPIGRSAFGSDFVAGGVEACGRGTVVAFDETTIEGMLVAEVEWDRGCRQLTPPGNLVRADLNAIMADLARRDRDAVWGIQFDPLHRRAA